MEPRTLGDFRILREIGRGGMGVVYEAEQISLGRRVALKVLDAHLTLQRETVERFHREANAAAGLRHPNILPVYFIGEEDGTHYFAMELVDGWSLEDVLQELRAARSPAATRSAREGLAALVEESRRRPVEWVCRLILDVAAALQEARAHDIVHRDVKPANILLRKDGTAVLIDFGLARDLHQPALTQVGQIVGSPYSVAPERLTEQADALDHRVDVYSLGVLMYELLTLKRPFEGESVQEVFQKIQTEEPPAPRRLDPQVPRDLETICWKAMEKSPEHRYATAGDLAEDVRRFLSYLPIRARPTSLWRRARKLYRRHRLETRVGFVLGAALVAFLVWVLTLPAWLAIETEPAGAKVWVDGEQVLGSTPLRVRTDAGQHEVTLELSDFETERRLLQATRGRTSSVLIQLASSSGVVHFETEPPGAIVRASSGDRTLTMDGRTPHLWPLPAGEYEVEMELPGFAVERRRILVPPRGRTILEQHTWPTAKLHPTSQQPGVVVQVFSGPDCDGEPLHQVALPLQAPLTVPPGVYSVRSLRRGHDQREWRGDRALLLEAEETASLPIWHAPLRTRLWELLDPPVSRMLAFDLRGDGSEELLLIDANGALRALDAAGSLVMVQDCGEPVSAVLALDLEQDGRTELLLGGRLGALLVLDDQGGVLHRSRRRGTVHSILAAPSPRAAAATDSGELLWIDQHGVEPWEAPPGEITHAAAVLGVPERTEAQWVVLHDTAVQAMSPAGKSLWRHELGFFSTLALTSSGGEHVTVVDRDEGTVHWLDGRGERTRRVELEEPLELVHGTMTSPPELIVASRSGRAWWLTEEGGRKEKRFPAVPLLILEQEEQEPAGPRGWFVLTERELWGLHADLSERFRADLPSRPVAAGLWRTDPGAAQRLMVAFEDGAIHSFEPDHSTLWQLELGQVRHVTSLREPSGKPLLLVHREPNRVTFLTPGGEVRRTVSLPDRIRAWLVSADRRELYAGGELGIWRVSNGAVQSLHYGAVLSLRWIRGMSGQTTGLAAVLEGGRVLAVETSGETRFELTPSGRGEVIALWPSHLDLDPADELTLAMEDGSFIQLDHDGSPLRRRRIAERLTAFHALPDSGDAGDGATAWLAVEGTQVQRLDRTGELLESATLPGEITAACPEQAAGGKLYLGTASGHVVSVPAEGALEQWPEASLPITVLHSSGPGPDQLWVGTTECVFPSGHAEHAVSAPSSEPSTWWIVETRAHGLAVAATTAKGTLTLLECPRAPSPPAPSDESRKGDARSP